MKHEKLVLADQEVDVLVDTPVLAVVDGKYGFGQTVAPQAVEVGIEKCKRMGLGRWLCAVRPYRASCRLGRDGRRTRLVSIHFVNAAAGVLVAPFGSVERRFSTAPYCIGVPLPGRAPLVLDFCNFNSCRRQGSRGKPGWRPLPADALIGPDGHTGDDPRLLYGEYQPGERRDIARGSVRCAPLATQGIGAGLMCEILGGALTGNGCAAPERRFSNGMFSLYVIRAHRCGRLVPEEVMRYVAYVKSAKSAPPNTETLVQGNPRSDPARAVDGRHTVSRETWSLLLETARSVGSTRSASGRRKPRAG